MKSVLVAVVLLALAGRPAGAENELSIYIGKAFTRDSDARLRQADNTRLTFHDVSWDDKSFEMPIYYGGRVTHYLKRHPEWGVAFDFFHYKVYADRSAALPVTGARGGVPAGDRERLGDTFQRLAMSHGVNYLTLNLVHRWRLHTGPRRSPGAPTSEWPQGRLQPYAGAGIGAVIPHVEVSIGGRAVGEYQWRGPGFQFFGGARYGLSKRWFLFAEYKYTHTTLTVDVPGGGLHTTLDSHHLVVGGSYRL